MAQRIEILDWHHKNGQNQLKTAWHFNLIYPNLKIEQPLVLSWTKEEAKWRELWEQTDHQSVAWTKFAKAESPSNILNFLGRVYPTSDSCPDYICIDKACLVLHHAIASGQWNIWKNTSRFIIDSYHYINHRTTDYMCQKYCNPGPLNGSAPNLVVVEHDRLGHPHYKCAFNTQACEQLNAWIGGFDSIVKRMTLGNFDWFMHVMLFLHTLIVIEKQAEKRMRSGVDVADEEDEEEVEVEDE